MTNESVSDIVAKLEALESAHISVVGSETEWVIVRRENPTVPRMTVAELVAQLRMYEQGSR